MVQSLILSRRIVVGAGLGMLGATGAAAQAARALLVTAEQALGPFYPVIRPLDQDSDLTRVKGRKGTAKGQFINVFGRVTDPAGRPVPHAVLDLWQANAAGRYDHPGDTHDAPLDPNFQGSARVTADASGNYRFRTIKPGSYPIGPGQLRTPHIHVDVKGRAQRLTTQFYFPDEPLNAKDILFPSANPQVSVLGRRVGAVRDDPGSLAFAWDIVLAVG